MPKSCYLTFQATCSAHPLGSVTIPALLEGTQRTMYRGEEVQGRCLKNKKVRLCLVASRLAVQPEVFVLEAVLHCRRCIEAPDILMRQPEELAPVQSHPVVIIKSLGDVVRISRH